MERVHRGDARRRCRRSRRSRARVSASSPKRSPRRRSRAQIQQVLAAHPGAKWIQWEPVHARQRACRRAAARIGQYLEPVYDFTKADVVLSLDADFLVVGGRRESPLLAPVRVAPAARCPAGSAEPVVRRSEPTPSVTGSERRSPDADQGERDRELRARDRRQAGRRRARVRRVRCRRVPSATSKRSPQDLAAHRGTSLVVAGEAQPPAVHALAHAINQALGNVGSTVTLSADAGDRPDRTARGAARARLRHERRPRADARDRRRIEPGADGAGRSEFRATR